MMTASPSNKNIVIVLDTSSSMAASITIKNNRTTRLEVAKEAVNSLLNTLSPDDQVCVLILHQICHACEPQRFCRARNLYKSLFYSLIQIQ